MISDKSQQNEQDKCQTCKSVALASMWVKCSDGFNFKSDDIGEYEGYVPSGIGIDRKGGAGDYVGFTYCLDCGQIQGEFPVSLEGLKRKIENSGVPH